MADEGLQLLAPGLDRDMLLLSWWGQLIDDGELSDIFAEVASTPTGFLGLFNNPTTAFFARQDAQGAAVMIWFEQFMGAAALGLWARKDFRGRKYWDDLIAAVRRVFEHVQLVMFMTKHPHVVAASRDFGFTFIGTMPYLYHGQPGHIAYLTREGFKERHG